MKYRRIWAAVVFTFAVMASISACGNGNTAETAGTTADSTATTTETAAVTEGPATAANETTTADTTEAIETATPDTDNSGADSVTVYYGWDIDDMDCTAEIYCPEGAKFSNYTLEVQESDGWVLSADVSDDIKGYSASSNSYWHRDAYTDGVNSLSILQQLYFEGEIDAQTAEEYSGCSQKVTPLGFRWKDMEVILVETTYTFIDYSEQTDLFVGVEYDLNYWKVEEGTGETVDLTTKGLFGFDIFSYGWDKLTQEQCAWIAGGLFGVDCGIENPFADSSDSVTADIDPSTLIGTWSDKDSGWGDTYFFDYNGNGSYTSGFESTFTYSVDGNVLTVFYAEDDIDIFTAVLNHDTLTLVDEYEYEQHFERVTEDTSENTEDSSNPNADAIIGTWKESETGNDQTFTFNADGTGHCSRLSSDGSYECDFTYNFFRSDFIDIYYDDGNIDGFLIAIDGDKMTVKNDFIQETVYTRQ